MIDFNLNSNKYTNPHQEICGLLHSRGFPLYSGPLSSSAVSTDYRLYARSIDGYCFSSTRGQSFPYHILSKTKTFLWQSFSVAVLSLLIPILLLPLWANRFSDWAGVCFWYRGLYKWTLPLRQLIPEEKYIYL